MKPLITFIIILGLLFNSFTQIQGKFIDSRDGKEYKTVRIKDQLWMAENLAYKPESGEYGAYNDDTSNVAKYGYLYGWETALIVCPKGWHLPTKEEFQTLLNNVGGNDSVRYSALNSGGSSGFNSLNGGYRYTYGFCDCLGKNAAYWTSTLADDIDGFQIHFDGTEKTVQIYDAGYVYAPCAFSIRCIKD
jgi:uncharacterized protein (TIGR02145 family)